MEMTSKPTELDEVDRSVLRLEMERLSVQHDTDQASHDRLEQLNKELEVLKVSQKELGEQWEHEKEIMSRIQSIKEEVTPLSPLPIFVYSHFSQLFLYDY
jgi:ATP-dependent Clp protease ATP-binding subunit ClpB